MARKRRLWNVPSDTETRAQPRLMVLASLLTSPLPTVAASIPIRRLWEPIPAPTRQPRVRTLFQTLATSTLPILKVRQLQSLAQTRTGFNKDPARRLSTRVFQLSMPALVQNRLRLRFPDPVERPQSIRASPAPTRSLTQRRTEPISQRRLEP